MSSNSAIISYIKEQSPIRLAAAAGASLGAAWLIKYILYRRQYPPGPLALPYLGNFGLITKTGSDVAMKVTNELYDTYGQVVTIMAGPKPIVFVLEPELVLEGLLAKQLSDRMGEFFSIDFITEHMNDIFVAPNNARWRYHRKAAHTAFRMFAQTDELEQLMTDSFYNVKQYFQGSQEPKDVYENVYLLMYNLQCRMAFSKEYTPDDPEFLQLRKNVDKMNEILITGLGADAFPILRYLPMKSTKTFVQIANQIHAYFKAICEQRQRSFSPGDQNDILDHLVKEQRDATANGKGELFTDVHLRQTLMDIFSAGTDTSAFTLYWVVFALSRYPDMQEKCYAEIASVFGDRTPSLAERHRLPYTDAFLHEVMRYWPLVGSLPRQCNEDNFTLGGYSIPKGTTVMLSIYRSHFDPKAFPQPHDFQPERFLDESGDKLAAHKRGFLPFGAGTRVCLGETIAKRTTFLLSVLLIQSFRFEKKPGDSDVAISESSNMFALMPRRYEVTVVPRGE